MSSESAGTGPARGGPAPAGAAAVGSATAGTEPFEYALIRVVPRVERGEAINAGVILYSQRHRFLGCLIQLNENRLQVLDPAVDVAAVRGALTALDEGCRGGRPGAEPPGVRFRWLTAPRSTIVQPSPVHGGLTADPAAELARLFDELVR